MLIASKIQNNRIHPLLGDTFKTGISSARSLPLYSPFIFSFGFKFLICTFIFSGSFAYIFFKNSPLHDGAMVISKKRIKAAGCILPVSHNLDIPKELGLRHRAAMGISQESDAHAIIVSEETGAISVAYRGQFYLRLNAEELESLLTKKS